MFAGIPTAFFLQVGFVRTLAARGETVRPSRLGGLYPPGLGFAIVRDCVYWAATQKQVQTARPTWIEELTCQFCVVGIPLVCDTLSVRAVEPSFRWPKSALGKLAMACPPAALLGRATWIPAYNWAYVATQQQIGTASWFHEGAGLIAGSLAASVVAYPLFVLKTNMLLVPANFTFSGLPRLVATAVARSFGVGANAQPSVQGVLAAVAHVYTGLRPHAIANIGPDVVCMAAARVTYAVLFSGFGAIKRDEKAWQAEA